MEPNSLDDLYENYVADIYRYLRSSAMTTMRPKI